MSTPQQSATPTPRMTAEYIDRAEACRHLLPEPGPAVVGEMLVEIRALRIELTAARAEVERLKERLENCANVGVGLEHKLQAKEHKLAEASGTVRKFDVRHVADCTIIGDLEEQLAARDATIAGLRGALEEADSFISEGYPSEPDTYRLNHKEEERALDRYQVERETYNTKQEALLTQIRAALAQVPPPKPETNQARMIP